MGSGAGSGAGWTIEVDGIDTEHERAHGVILTLADGAISSSGAPPGSHPAADPHVFAPGLYRGTGRDSELAECPAWMLLPFELTDDMSIRRALDLRYGVLSHRITTADGEIAVDAFSSLDRPGTTALRAIGPAPMLGGGPLLTGGRHEDGTDVEHSRVDADGVQLHAAAMQRSTARGIDRFAAYTRSGRAEATDAVRRADAAGFDALLIAHRARWASRWEHADVVIDGDDELQLAVRFALFHLMGQVSDSGEAAVGARGATGRAYRGHVFWDADVFVLPFLAATHPAAARAMLEYRIRRLPAALQSAERRGRRGARFPWESAADGFDVTPTTARDHTGHVVPIRTGENEEHIVADIAWAADHYVRWTGDEAFERGPGRELWIETARYWASRARTVDGLAHIFGVIGPDEYHESVDDNAYTNVMARWNLRRAAAAAGDTVGRDERDRWLALADALVDGYDTSTRIYEQFSGFSDLEPLLIADAGVPRPVAADVVFGRDRVRRAQVIKQADVLMLHHLVPDEVATGSLGANLDFYEPRTAHGSSLSPGVHASLFARAGRPDEGLEPLRLAARVDLDDITHATSGGLHLATMGSVWQALVFGFAGIRPRGDVLHIAPRPATGWRSIEIRLRFRGAAVRVAIDHDDVRVESDRPIRTEVDR